MDTDFILEEVVYMRPSSFSDKERLRYRAEKMLMRQFVLMKQKHEIPSNLSTIDMKKWLLGGRSFLEEFREIAERADARKLLLAELAWISARRLCVNQLEKEVQEDLQNEERLSLQFRRKVTLEGLEMFLSVICPKAQQDVQAFFHQLSKKLLDTTTSTRTGKRTKLALFAKFQRTTAPLVPQVVKTALEFLLHKPEPLVEVRTSQTAGAACNSGSSLAFILKSRAKAASPQIGKQLADTLGTCPSLNRTLTKARLLSICTAVAFDIVKAIYKRFSDHSKTFHIMDFDGSFIIGPYVICAIQDMDDRARHAANRRTPRQDKKNCTAPEACSVVAAEKSNEMKDKEEKQGLFHFFGRMWKKMMRVSTEE
ncbi:hypothetical protein E3U43_012113 [Larimichthys crocea]|uniref:Uncharacterized protein n=1 Tax=Larimichthys crocea TaxID=215358 RepID=A0ACD3RTC3_LARCR|nr:hypothetical protein E3U43_012113 [Larimichthys crocea]